MQFYAVLYVLYNELYRLIPILHPYNHAHFIFMPEYGQYDDSCCGIMHV